MNKIIGFIVMMLFVALFILSYHIQPLGFPVVEMLETFKHVCSTFLMGIFWYQMGTVGTQWYLYYRGDFRSFRGDFTYLVNRSLPHGRWNIKLW